MGGGRLSRGVEGLLDMTIPGRLVWLQTLWDCTYKFSQHLRICSIHTPGRVLRIPRRCMLTLDSDARNHNFKGTGFRAVAHKT